MSRTAVSICNSALLLVGAQEINSFTDDTNDAKLCASLYDDVKESLLQSFTWRFSLVMYDLGGALTETPVIPKWDKIFQLPPDVLRVVNIQDNQDYEIFADKIFKNGASCKIIYQRNVAESDMPAYFVQALKYHMAKLLSMSLQEDGGKMQLFERSADKETQRARSIDSQQQPNSGIQETEFSFVNVRG